MDISNDEFAARCSRAASSMSLADVEASYATMRAECAIWDAAALADLPMDAQTASWLQTFGLPRKGPYGLTFDGAVVQPLAGYFVIGRSYEYPVAIDLRNAASVVGWDQPRAGDGDVWFLNSSVTCLAGCLLIFRRYGDLAKGLSDAQANAIAKAVGQALRTFDPAAFDRDNSYWPGVIEEATYGLI
jgi:hypothetical protein